MATIKPLLQYLPQYMQEYVEMQKIMNAEQPELDDAWDGVSNVWDNQFLSTATAEGLSRWEKMLDVSPKPTDTLDERRFRIFALLNQQLPYTMPKLRETLTRLCGEDGWSIILQANIYKMYVRLGLQNQSNFNEVQKILSKMVPANMIADIKLFNTYDILNEFTHGYLKEGGYTYEEIRKEVLV